MMADWPIFSWLRLYNSKLFSPKLVCFPIPVWFLWHESSLFHPNSKTCCPNRIEITLVCNVAVWVYIMRSEKDPTQDAPATCIQERWGEDFLYNYTLQNNPLVGYNEGQETCKNQHSAHSPIQIQTHKDTWEILWISNVLEKQGHTSRQAKISQHQTEGSQQNINYKSKRKMDRSGAGLVAVFY